MSLGTGIGAERNLLEETPEHAHQLVMDQPILRNHELETLRNVSHDVFTAHTIDITWPVDRGPGGPAEAPGQRVRRGLRRAVRRASTSSSCPTAASAPSAPAIPSLLAVAAVHHHLVRAGTRLRAGLVLESGEPREVHHFATLIGFGASAINPYLLFDTVDEMVADGPHRRRRRRPTTAQKNVVKAIGKGLLKTISKMGISTTQSYCGAQIFEAVGLEKRAHRPALHRHRVADRRHRHRRARARDARQATRAPTRPTHDDLLPVGGVYAWRRDGERHMWNPETVALLQHAVRSQNGNAQDKYDEYARMVNDDATQRSTLRGLMKFRTRGVTPVPLEEVEPAKEIVKRFATGAMSLGSISTPAHETLAKAMNALGGKSNTGEGGEDPRRFADDRRSAIKQVASGRFGVTINYLVNADQLQIKMAQGAKPGEGGQLPGHKVDRYIGSIRHSTPGVGLISPPPHHDIYSIEDLKQLIYDLRCSNPTRVGLGEARLRGRRRHGRRGRREGERRPRAHRRPRRRHGRLAAVSSIVAPACRGRSAWPRRSRRCCATTCARASSCRPTAS